MAETAQAVRKELAAHADETVDLIVHITGDVGVQSEVLAQRGIEVKRRYRLTRTISIRCSGRKALALLKEPWVTKVDLDRPVKALRRE